MNMLFFSSCDIYKAYSIVGIQTKYILNKQAIHINDTLYVIQPFCNVYMAKRDWNFESRDSDPMAFTSLTFSSVDYENYDIFNHPTPEYYHPYPEGSEQVSKFIKENYRKYLTCYNFKKEITLSVEDSAFVAEQMEPIKRLLKEVSVKRLEMPDSLYNCLAKYGHTQFFITDILDYYAPFTSGGSNLHNLYRFFIFDMESKELCFFAFDLGAYNAGLPTIMPNDNMEIFTLGETFLDKEIRRYCRQIKKGYRKAMRNKSKINNTPPIIAW